MIDERTWSRLRWRCRRGLLENNILLTRFLDRVGRDMPETDLAALDVLLDMSDNALWDVLSGRSEPDDQQLQSLVRQLRNA